MPPDSEVPQPASTRNMSYKNLITKKDLYELSEKEVIEKIENCNYKDISKKFNFWKNAYEIKESDKEVKGKYCVNINAKIRYINPVILLSSSILISCYSPGMFPRPDRLFLLLCENDSCDRAVCITV